MSANFYELLKYAATGQASPDMTYYDKLRASTLMGGVVQTLTGIPPLSFKSDGSPITVWSMIGNGSQTGTPTPDNPVMPEMCGVRTGNLWSDSGFSATVIGSMHTHTASNDYGTTLSNTSGRETEITQVASGGTANYQNGFFFFDVDFSALSDGDNLVFSFDYIVTNRLSTEANTVAYVGLSSNAKSVYTTSGNWGKSGTAYITFKMSSNIQNPYIELRLCGNSIKVSNVQLARGTTLKPYEPYGWAEKITCAGQTVPVYLGQVSTVRRIKKLVLTGQETGWTENSSGTNTLRAVLQLSDANENGASGYCSHTKFVTSGASRDEELAGTLNGNLYLRIRKTITPDITAFKQWLADEYANGEPVCVWYVLAEAETGIVNEPLAKIGTYADELHSEDAGVSIPTIKGSNTLTVDTPIQPSEMTITFKG